ncbi:MAG: flippase [Anaerolineae bacterium]|nr:flippase [Anaerolineae bacterium]
MSQTTAEPTSTRSAGRIIVRNTLFGMGAQIALRVVSFVFQVLVVRALGDEEFGRYAIVLAWAGLFSVIGDLGINQYLAREIARDRSKANELFWDTVVLRFGLAVIAAVITTVGAAWNGYDQRLVLAVAIYTSSYFLQAILAPLSSILTGNERVDIVSVMGVITQILFMVFAAIFLLLEFDFVWLVIASVINLPIMTVLHLWAIRRNKLGPPQFRVNTGLWWSVVRAGLPFGLIQLSLSFAFRVDTIFLSGHVPDAHVGWYNVAYNLTLTLMTLSRTFNDAILPTLARQHANNPDSVRPWYYQSVRMILAVGLPVAVGGMLTAEKIVALLYQPEIAPAAIALAILVWDIPFVMYHSFCGNITQSINREDAAARVYFSLGVVNIVLNLILIPRFGIIGSAFATVLTDLIGAAQFYFFLRKEFGAGLNFKRLARLGLATIVMGLMIYLLFNLNLLIIVLTSAAAYLTLIWVSGAFSPEERQLLIGFIARRLPSRKQSVTQ